MRTHGKYLLILCCAAAFLACPKKEEAPPWTNISQTELASHTPGIAAGSNGHVYVVWSDTTPGNVEIFFAEKPANESWSQGINISNSPNLDAAPFIDVDNLGNVHVCWWNVENTEPSEKICYRMRTTDGVWQNTEILAGNTSPQISDDLPRIICDSNDNVIIVWFKDNTLAYRIKPLNGVWSDEMIIPNSFTTTAAELANDQQGNIHVVWAGGSYQLNYQMRAPDGTWHNLATVVEAGEQPYGCDITTDGSGVVYITWDREYGSEGSHYVYYTCNRSGAWSERIELPKVRESDEGGASACVAADDGTLHIIWRNWRRDTTVYVAADIYYVKQYPDGTWSSVYNISNTESESRCNTRGIALDGWGNIHIVWTDYEPGNYDILYMEVPKDSLQ